MSIGKMLESLDQKVWPKSALISPKRDFPLRNLADVLFLRGEIIKRRGGLLDVFGYFLMKRLPGNCFSRPLRRRDITVALTAPAARFVKAMISSMCFGSPSSDS